MQPNQDLEYVIHDGIRFLESLTRYYGPEQGMAVWEALGTALGTDVKGRVFFAMLTGELSDRITIEQGTATNAVWVIKAIRAGTGMSLKQAKDAWDDCKTRPVRLTATTPAAKREMTRTLRDIGILVG